MYLKSYPLHYRILHNDKTSKIHRYQRLQDPRPEKSDL
jgi:hypothetical protein